MLKDQLGFQGCIPNSKRNHPRQNCKCSQPLKGWLLTSLSFWIKVIRYKYSFVAFACYGPVHMIFFLFLKSRGYALSCSTDLRPVWAPLGRSWAELPSAPAPRPSAAACLPELSSAIASCQGSGKAWESLPSKQETLEAEAGRGCRAALTVLGEARRAEKTWGRSHC